MHPAISFGLVGVLVVTTGCLSAGDKLVERRFPAADEEEAVLSSGSDAGAVRTDGGSLSLDPHAVLGLEPNHGPFTGGQLALIRGNGFGSDVAIWFGDEQVPPASVVPVDAKRVQVQVPAGASGAVDVTTQNGNDASTRRVLKEGYEYDAFFVLPNSGSTSGGGIVTLFGDDTGWSMKSMVQIDLAACEVLEIRRSSGEPDELDCRTPPGTPGQKPVTVETKDREKQTVSDGYTYADSLTGFEGGLSGDALGDSIEVLVLNGATGGRVAGATVLLGDGGELRATTDSTGRAVVSDLGSAKTITVTVAMPCMQPVTLVDVPVERATVYINPVLIPACIPPIDDLPDIPGGGGGGVARSNTIQGELAFGLGVEYKRGGWLNVPQARTANEAQVAYVFELSPSARQTFELPSRFEAVTPEADGTLGYAFRYDTRSSGNLTLYALAGIERNTSPRQFTPYAFGLLRGVNANSPDSRPFIPMKLTLDHVVTLDIVGPKPTPRGPDRVEVDLALRIGRSGFVPLPRKRVSILLPVADPLEFIGVPQLAGSLLGAQYVSFAKAVSGALRGLPWSELEATATSNSDVTIPLTHFVEVPVLVEPGHNSSWSGQQLRVDWAAGGSRVDLIVFDIASAGGASSWTVIAPGDKKSIDLPKLSEQPGLGLSPGRVNITVSAARITDFDYASLRERDFSAAGWTAYATDTYPSLLP